MAPPYSILTISATHNPATDLGYLLHKNPTRLQSEEISFGTAYVFYPKATAELCTVALLWRSIQLADRPNARRLCEARNAPRMLGLSLLGRIVA